MRQGEQEGWIQRQTKDIFRGRIFKTRIFIRTAPKINFEFSTKRLSSNKNGFMGNITIYDFTE